MMRVVIATLALALVACGSGRGSSAAPGSGVLGARRLDRGSIAVDTDRFPHRRAYGRAAGDLGVVRGRASRAPTATTPPPCVRDALRGRAPISTRRATTATRPSSASRRASSARSATPRRRSLSCKGASPLQGYPERGATQTLASAFSHRLHLDRSKMEQASGAHVACADCHERSADTRDPLVPGHDDARAAARQGAARVKARLPMEQRAGCHPQRNVELVRGRRSHHHGRSESRARDAREGCARRGGGVHGVPRERRGVGVARGHAGAGDGRVRAVPRGRQEEPGPRADEQLRGVPRADRVERAAGEPRRRRSGRRAKPSDHTLEFRKHREQSRRIPSRSAGSAGTSRCRGREARLLLVPLW